MGLTERHLFEDEDVPENYEWALEDAVYNSRTNKMKEQEPVHAQKREFAHMWFWCCSSCGVAITEGDKFCRNCGKKVKWE